MSSQPTSQPSNPIITSNGLRPVALRVRFLVAIASLGVATGVLAGTATAVTSDAPATDELHDSDDRQIDDREIGADDGMTAPPPRAPKDRARRDRDGAGRGADGADAPARPGRPPGDLLSGPKVVDEDAADSGAPPRRDGAGAPRGQGEGQARRARPEQVRLWLEALKSIELEPEKREAIRIRVEAFAAERSAFERAHGKERRELEQELRQAGRDGAPPKALRERMQALMAKAPNPEVVQREVYAMLSSTQQEALRERFAALETERAERQARERERQMQRREGMDGDAKRGDGAPGRDASRPSRPSRPPGAPRPPKGESDTPPKGAGDAPPKRGGNE